MNHLQIKIDTRLRMNSEYVNIDKISKTKISVLSTNEIKRLEKLLTDAQKKL